MRWAGQDRVRALLIALALIVVLAGLVVWLSRRSLDQRKVLTWSGSQSVPSPISSSAEPPSNSERANSPTGASPSSDNGSTPGIPQPTPPAGSLIIPVAGVRPDQLRDTFSEARSEGRVHDAIDIPAPRGTPVLAAADGKILKLFQSERGGTTIYQLSSDGKFVYYYAHLDRYAEGLSEGHFAKQGDTIAYVGDTGNAGTGNYHLHFSVAVIPDPKRYWEGVNINPYPLLRR